MPRVYWEKATRGVLLPNRTDQERARQTVCGALPVAGRDVPVDLATLHHEQHAAHVGDIVQGTTFRGDQVSFHTGSDAAARRVTVVLGTDAVAGGQGMNREEFIYRVRDGGHPAMDAIVSATSRAAESLGLGGRIGAACRFERGRLWPSRRSPLR